ncbi:sensor histidine kinase [Novosphingobium album (ex Liu et al. 2023)]|uniref:histidine kinase n=1 Tax=Novosphingobium album (ex Liu et al. 2023) TaxID=3031130 RepID=A0ABT5WSH6_9SPHN|nr:HAMP domain-containing sensor histidine kinase [Novosphingobium album (ex Liu et al. 2023)]MDE8652987.1 HAMP domain-containing sensor histidine kinase [Novosphingobium album (ex Liu et al. 2023)]
MKRLLRSLSFRLTLIYAGLFCLSVALLMGTGYWFRVVQPLDQARASVEREAERFGAIYRAQGLAAARAALDRRSHAANQRKPFHALIAANGKVVTANLPSWPRARSGSIALIEADIFIDGFESDYYALLRDQVFPDGTRLLVGRDVEDIMRQEEVLRTAAIWIFGGTLLLGLTGGWLMSLAIGRRIDMVSSAARQVMDGDLSGRVRVRGTNDDFDRLGETLNLMLSRIQTLFEAVRRVSDNVAHELRTPLARLVGKLEALERQAGDNVEMRIAIDEAIVQADQLRQIFAALLRISRLEGGRHPLRAQRTDVVQLLEDVVEFYQPEAERRDVRLVLDAKRPLIADLDLDLVFQALCNLLDNALKHVPPGCRVDVAAALSEGSLHLAISDNGPGVEAGEIVRITEQFYRGAASSGVPGEGLGLSMVAAIAQVHGATIAFADNAPGLRVTLSFPAVRARGT